MKKMSFILLSVVMVAAFLLFGASLALAGQQQFNSSPGKLPSNSGHDAGQPANQPSDEPIIRETERISIPFGFASPLPILPRGQGVVASGHGSCSAGEEVTVLITVTIPSTGATATGMTEETCLGEETLQYWHANTALVTGSPPMTAADAEACGFATTRDGGEVTDTFEWCRKDVTLTWPSYLPLIVRSSGE